MPEYVSEELKRAVRAEALERAVELSKVADSFNDRSVVVTAAAFEDYILNGLKPAVAAEPLPGNPRKRV